MRQRAPFQFSLGRRGGNDMKTDVVATRGLWPRGSRPHCGKLDASGMPYT
jgi:hypothetical protein